MSKTSPTVILSPSTVTLSEAKSLRPSALRFSTPRLRPEGLRLEEVNSAKDPFHVQGKLREGSLPAGRQVDSSAFGLRMTRRSSRQVYPELRRKARTITVAVLGSHSALDVCRGAKDEGFKTLVIVEKGRDRTYAKYFKSARPSSGSAGSGPLGCVDDVLHVEKFKDILLPKVQKILNSKNCIFVPNRSFEVYINDYDAIENDFKIHMFGNRKLLRIEERTEKPNQYDLLKKAGIKHPKQFKNPDDIDRLVIVKAQEKERSFERGFFLAYDRISYNRWSIDQLKKGKITKEELKNAIIEEFIIGVQVNFNFFYSAVNKRLELIGTDTRRQTNYDGLTRLLQEHQQEALHSGVRPTFEEAGHIAVTTLESMLEPAFEIGEKFVKAAREMMPPGVIGPFSLQSVITPGPPKKEIVVFDVSPRMPGSPGISSTPYSGYLFGKNISMGRRVAMEIKEAIRKKQLSSLLT